MVLVNDWRAHDIQKWEYVFFFSSRRRHTRYWRDWSSDVCSSDLELLELLAPAAFSGLAHFEGRGALSGRLGTRVAAPAINLRSEERRVGKESRSRWSPYH